jgi:hypothetical protein
VPVELAERVPAAPAPTATQADERGADQCEARDSRRPRQSDFNRAVCGKKLVASRSVFERTSADEDELHALDDGYPTTDRLNPGRASSYV